MKAWLLQFPKRFEWELEALRKAGLKFEIRSQDITSGELEISIPAEIGGSRIPLLARFPCTYPFTRFEIIAPELDLPHHQNPFFKNLCLIGRASSNWRLDDSLASFITERVPQVIATALEKDVKKLANQEEQQGEPISSYYEYLNNASVLIDSEWNSSEATSGELTFGFTSSHPRPRYYCSGTIAEKCWAELMKRLKASIA
jgi:hypothetical protein